MKRINTRSFFVIFDLMEFPFKVRSPYIAIPVRDRYSDKIYSNGSK